MSEQVVDGHNYMHSEHGALAEEHPGRSANPLIKVHDGDVIEATAATDDGAIDLGVQRNRVVYK